MANKLWRNKKVMQHGMIQYHAKFFPNADQPLDADEHKDGYGFGIKAVERASEGVFTVTFEKSPRDIVFAKAELVLETAAAAFTQIGVVDLSAGTFQVRVLGTTDTAAPAVTDIDADPGNYILLDLTVQKSGVTQ